MEKIYFFLNPGAGSGIPEDFEAVIGEQAGREGFDYRIHQISGGLDQEDVTRLLDDYSPNIAVAAGGDGTINLIARSLIGREIKLGIIPLGSSNGMAYQLNIPNDPMEALRTIVTGKSREVDMIQVNREHISLHMSDLGMNARVIRRYEVENVRGFYGYARQYFREFGMRSKFRVTLTTEDQTIHAHAIMVVLANGSYYGTGASISPEGRPDDGVFEVVIIRAYPFWFLFYMLISVFIRKVGKRQFSRIFQCREAEINVTPPQEMQVDGEPLGLQENISARILPGCLAVIAGS